MDPTWVPSRLPGPKWERPTPSTLHLLLQSWRAPPACLSCSPSASLLFPQDQRGPEGASEGVPSPIAGQTSPANWAGEILGVLLLIQGPKRLSRCGNPFLLSHPSGPVLPPLLLAPQSPHVLPVCRWQFLPSPWALRSPPVSARCPNLWGDVNSASSHTTILTLLFISLRLKKKSYYGVFHTFKTS